MQTRLPVAHVQTGLFFSSSFFNFLYASSFGSFFFPVQVLPNGFSSSSNAALAVVPGFLPGVRGITVLCCLLSVGVQIFYLSVGLAGKKT